MAGIPTRANPHPTTVAEAESLRRQVLRWAESLSPSILAAADARGVLEAALAIKHAASAVEGMAAKALADAAAWHQSGDRSAAHLLSRLSGTSVNDARETLATAERLEGLPALQAAVQRGELSPRQSVLIAGAATVDPAAQEDLLSVARSASLGELGQACAKRRAAADPDPEATRARIHRGRYLRTHHDTEGAWNLHARATTDVGARIMAALAPFAEERFQAARRAGRREPLDAYQLDALATMAEVASAAPDASFESGGTLLGTTGPESSTEVADVGPLGERGAVAGASLRRPAGARSNHGAGPRTTGSGGAAVPSGDISPHDAAGSGRMDPGPRPSGSRRAAGSPGARTASGPGATGFQDGPGAAGPRGDASTGSDATATGPASPPAPPGAPTDRPRRRPPAKIIVRIDMDALLRGRTIGEETCELAGIPVPVSVVQEMLTADNPFLAAVVTKGKAVAGVVHLGRRPTAAQMTALEWLSPSCSVLGCSQSTRLEIDHVEDWADTHVTRIEQLAPLCGHHHWLKTNEDWALVKGTGKRAMVPPGDPRHPKQQANGATGPRQGAQAAGTTQATRAGRGTRAGPPKGAEPSGGVPSTSRAGPPGQRVLMRAGPPGRAGPGTRTTSTGQARAQRATSRPRRPSRTQAAGPGARAGPPGQSAGQSATPDPASAGTAGGGHRTNQGSPTAAPSALRISADSRRGPPDQPGVANGW